MLKFDVIGLSGKSGTGKDYIIQQCLRPEGYFQISFAWHFKIWLISTGQATYEEVFYTKPEHIRRLMQLEGTERGRDVYGPDVWVDTAFAWMQLWNETWGISKFVIGDVRFPNEADRILELGGKVIRITAPERVENSILTAEQKRHISETALDTYDKFSGYVFNGYDAYGRPMPRQEIQNAVDTIRRATDSIELLRQDLWKNISEEIDAEIMHKAREKDAETMRRHDERLRVWQELDRQYWKLLEENDGITKDP